MDRSKNYNIYKLEKSFNLYHNIMRIVTITCYNLYMLQIIIYYFVLGLYVV